MRPEIYKILIMKMSLITLFIGLTLNLTAQVPNWTQQTCDGNTYSMYTELSKGKAVVLNFSSLWCAGSNAGAEATESLWQNMMNENVKVFGFIDEDHGFNDADCDDLNLWGASNGISYPNFINIKNVLDIYVNKYTQSGATTLPWFLLFIPHEENTGKSRLVYSGHDMNTLNHILYDEWLQVADLTENNAAEKQLVKIIDQLGRETEFKANTPLTYVYSDGSTKKIFTIGQ